MTEAWLEQLGGEPVPIRGTCSIGRTASNHLVLGDERVSRRHAIVHVQEHNEYWLVDLGSSNGTFLNGRRVSQPTKLHDQDRLDIGPFSVVFRQLDAAKTVLPSPITGDKTILEIKAMPCWLLVADIVGSTQLGQRLSANEMSLLTGGWLAECKQVVEECAGCMDKYLGDGFLAYWQERDRALVDVVRVTQALKRLQAQAHPQFRLALHYGAVATGGIGSLGRESLWGPEINFVFRMEKLAAVQSISCLMSATAFVQSKGQIPAVEIGSREVTGFKGSYLFYQF